MLCGPRHIGKSLFAREMAAMLMCVNTETRPCGSCAHCQHFSRNVHPDVYRVGPELGDDANVGSQSISIEDIRDCIDRLHMSALFRHRKILFIENAELLTVGASNALLKTLEEPHGDTLFVLVSNSEEALLPTIRSRCQLIRMYPLPIQLLYRELTRRHVPSELALTLARFSKGRFGLISRFVERQSEWSATARQLEQDAQTLFGPGADKHRWYEDTDSIPFASFVDFVHDLLLVNVGLPERAVLPHSTLKSFGDRETKKLVDLLETCVRAIKLRSQNVNQKLLLDLIHTRARTVV